MLFACAMPLRETGGKAIDLGIVMDLIAENGHRKWAYRAQMVTAVTALVLLGMQAEPAAAAKPLNLIDLFSDGSPRLRGGVHSAKIPLPRPRPAEAPASGGDSPAATAQPTEPDKPAEQAAPATPAAPQPSACRFALTEDIAIAPSIPDIKGPGGCGGTDLVRLEAIVLPDKKRVALTPAATLRCAMATEIADWVRTDIAALTQKLGSEITTLDNYDSYECRGFNRIPGAHLSEHGRANALDVRAFKLADGRSIALTDPHVAHETREAVLHSVCSRFVTVLGPGSDGYHEEHIHLDLMEHQNKFKLCHWEIYDPLPQIAPLMPAERPEDAPPREVAAKSGGDKGEAAKPDAAPAAGDEPAQPADPPPAKKPASKKKRQ
jgi:hypothetical protein